MYTGYMKHGPMASKNIWGEIKAHNIVYNNLEHTIYFYISISKKKLSDNVYEINEFKLFF